MPKVGRRLLIGVSLRLCGELTGSDGIVTTLLRSLNASAAVTHLHMTLGWQLPKEVPRRFHCGCQHGTDAVEPHLQLALNQSSRLYLTVDVHICSCRLSTSHAPGSELPARLSDVRTNGPLFGWAMTFAMPSLHGEISDQDQTAVRMKLAGVC